MGNSSDKTYEARLYPASRRLVVDACEWGRKKHIIHALSWFDVQRPRDLIRRGKAATGEGLSFTAFVAACVGRAVAEDRICHAYRRGSKLLLFDDVDIATLVEHDVEGAKLATLYVIRAADKKGVLQIHREIRVAQQLVVEADPGVAKWRWYVHLPAFLRRLLYRFMDLSPVFRRKLGGTVVLTAVGMAAQGAGWGVPIATGTLTIVLGGIETKPGIVEGRIEAREFLCVTVSFDHDIVDGLPAARFVARLRELVEQAYGLDEATCATGPQGAAT
jgi:pyruvate/2-oxoglutarate dehydrogenase complex dihydrolipoamide acyltransferase (E2) component